MSCIKAGCQYSAKYAKTIYDDPMTCVYHAISGDYFYPYNVQTKKKHIRLCRYIDCLQVVRFRRTKNVKVLYYCKYHQPKSQHTYNSDEPKCKMLNCLEEATMEGFCGLHFLSFFAI